MARSSRSNENNGLESLAADVAVELLKHPGSGPGLTDGWESRSTRFVGPKTVLPSSFKVTVAADALVAAFCSAIATYTESTAPTGTRADVVVHSIGTATAMRSERNLRGERPAALWDELSGHYATSDGFIQFHTNFDHHRIALLTATGCGPNGTRSDVEHVVAESERFELEQLVIDAGGIAAALRTPEEWNDHPHAVHVAGHQPLTVSPISSSKRRPIATGEPGRPLAGLRVLDMTRVIAGPVCSRTLAAYGADVLRIGAERLPMVDSLLADTTLGKRFAHCDITTEQGRSTVLRLAADADVVVTGFRPGALARHGLGRDAFLDANPGLILAELSAFGETGPWGTRPGFDSITQTATGVVASETAAFGGDVPRPLPCQLLDHGTGFLLALGVVSALLNRLNGAGGQLVTTSLLTTRNWLWSLGTDNPSAGRLPDSGQLEAFTEIRDTPYGRISHAKPPGRIVGIPARWTTGPALPGADKPIWR